MLEVIKTPATRSLDEAAGATLEQRHIYSVTL